MQQIFIAFDDGDGITRAWATGRHDGNVVSVGGQNVWYQEQYEASRVVETMARMELVKYLETTAGQLNFYNRLEDYTMRTEVIDDEEE